MSDAEKSPVRLALVGPGRWGRILVESVQGQSDSLRFTHAVSRDPDRVAAWCAAQGVQPVATLAEVLADPIVDALVLATPHSLHVPQIVAAAAAGKDIYCEKPLALTRAEADRAWAAVETAGVLLAVGHNHRFLPGMDKMGQMIRDNALGRILHLEGNMSSHVGFGEVYTAEMWRLAPGESPAGGMAAAGIHILDLMIQLAGPVTSVVAESARLVLPIPHDDTTSLLLRFANRATGTVSTSTATGREFRLQVFGDKGWLELRERSCLTWASVSGIEDVWQFPKTELERRALEAFAACVRSRQPFPVSKADVTNGISVFEGVTASLETGQRIEITG